MPDKDPKTPSPSDNLDLLNEFASGEDEFDVDLMASGCRLATTPQLKLSIYDLVQLHNLDFDRLVALLGAVIDETSIDTNKLFQLADKAGRGKIAEAGRDKFAESGRGRAEARKSKAAEAGGTNFAESSSPSTSDDLKRK